MILSKTLNLQRLSARWVNGETILKTLDGVRLERWLMERVVVSRGFRLMTDRAAKLLLALPVLILLNGSGLIVKH